MNEADAYNVGYSFGTIGAAIIIYGGIIAIGVYFGNRLGQKRDGVFVRWPVGLAIAIALLLMVGRCSDPKEAGSAEAPTAVSPEVVVQQQANGPASGFTKDFSAQYLRAYESRFHDALISGLQHQGEQVEPQSLTVSSDVITMEGNKVIRTKASVPSKLFIYQFAGVSNGNATNVVCTSASGGPFDPSGTDCARRVKQAFGHGS